MSFGSMCYNNVNLFLQSKLRDIISPRANKNEKFYPHKLNRTQRDNDATNGNRKKRKIIYKNHEIIGTAGWWWETNDTAGLRSTGNYILSLDVRIKMWRSYARLMRQVTENDIFLVVFCSARAPEYDVAVGTYLFRVKTNTREIR